jgi:cyclomaltodextrinase
VLFDGVFNHVGRGHPAFVEVLEQGPQAPHAGWFKLSWPDGARQDAEPEYACFEGHRQLVTLNHDKSAVADYVVSVMTYWLALGVDGWRLDAAYAVPRHFWSDVLARVRSVHPGAYIVGEIIHGDYAAIVRDTGMDAVTQYELWKAIWSALNDRNLFELAHALDRHNGFLAKFVPLTFVGNHDVTRIASRLVDERHLPHALAILLICGGTPSIYAGDEQAFRGLKEDRIGGDDAVRPVFPGTPAGLAPYGWPVYRLHQSLLALRRRHSWLHHARTRTLHLTNEHLVLAVGDGSRHLLLALNLADDAVLLPAPNVRSVAAGEAVVVKAGTHDALVSLGPHSWVVLTV